MISLAAQFFAGAYDPQAVLLETSSGPAEEILRQERPWPGAARLTLHSRCHHAIRWIEVPVRALLVIRALDLHSR